MQVEQLLLGLGYFLILFSIFMAFDVLLFTIFRTSLGYRYLIKKYGSPYYAFNNYVEVLYPDVVIRSRPHLIVSLILLFVSLMLSNKTYIYVGNEIEILGAAVSILMGLMVFLPVTRKFKLKRLLNRKDVYGTEGYIKEFTRMMLYNVLISYSLIVIPSYVAIIRLFASKTAVESSLIGIIKDLPPIVNRLVISFYVINLAAYFFYKLYLISPKYPKIAFSALVYGYSILAIRSGFGSEKYKLLISALLLIALVVTIDLIKNE